jgi:hypothetical protein
MQGLHAWKAVDRGQEGSMTKKGSNAWYRQMAGEWNRYMGWHATVEKYAATGGPYVKHLRQDLKERWGAHPNPEQCLSTDEIEALAGRLAEYVELHPRPVTPPGLVAQYLPGVMEAAKKENPEDLPNLTPMIKSAADEGAEDEAQEEPDAGS